MEFKTALARFAEEHEWKHKVDPDFPQEVHELALRVKRPLPLLIEALHAVYFVGKKEDFPQEDLLGTMTAAQASDMLVLVAKNTFKPRVWKVECREALKGVMGEYEPSPPPREVRREVQKGNDITTIVEEVVRRLSVTDSPMVSKTKTTRCTTCRLSPCECSRMLTTKRRAPAKKDSPIIGEEDDEENEEVEEFEEELQEDEADEVDDFTSTSLFKIRASSSM